MKKEIVLVWTRDFTLAWAEWWSIHMHPRLVEVFGTGVPNQVSYFNGRLLETYRLADESKAFIEAVVDTDPRGGILGEDKIKHYIVVIRQIHELIEKTNKTKAFADQAVFEKLQELSREMYPWYTVSYLLPQKQWAGQLMKKYPKESRDILNRLIDARKNSEGTIEELIEYWRAVARVLLSQRKLSSRYASFVTFGEIGKMFDDKNYTPDRKKLETRSRSYIFLGDSVYTGITKKIFFEKHGFNFVVPANDVITQEVKGTVCFAGPSSIKGAVSVILRNDEIANFKEGNILITVMTNPFFIPIMKKAAAIVTDEGGITCHAAIVARELRIPCIIGTKIATKVLKDGDRVEVDAYDGTVKKLN